LSLFFPDTDLSWYMFMKSEIYTIYRNEYIILFCWSYTFSCSQNWVLYILTTFFYHSSLLLLCFFYQVFCLWIIRICFVVWLRINFFNELKLENNIFVKKITFVDHQNLSLCWKKSLSEITTPFFILNG
jgi:hypothetical protein